MGDYYSLLGLSFDFSDEALLRKNYRRAALLAHPDRHSGSSARFLELKNALETLQHDRASYDEKTFATRRVPCDMTAAVEERAEGDVVVVSWQRMERPAVLLRVRGEGTLEWTLCFQGSKRRVAVQGLAPGGYEFAVCVPGGPPRVISCLVPDRLEEKLEQLRRLAGFSRAQAVKALARHGTVQGALDDLMQRGTMKKGRKKKKKKKKAEEEPSAAMRGGAPKSDVAVDEAFLLANVKCSRCKVVIPLELVESHTCDPEAAMARFQ